MLRGIITFKYFNFLIILNIIKGKYVFLIEGACVEGAHAHICQRPMCLPTLAAPIQRAYAHICQRQMCFISPLTNFFN